MNVLIDDRTAVNQTGIGRYTRTLAQLATQFALPLQVRALSEAAPEFRPRDPLEAALTLPGLLQELDVDVYHSALFALPPVLPCPSVITIHDAIPCTHPELTQPGFAALFQREAGAAARRAACVVTPSEHAAEQVSQALGLDRARVRVVPEAPAGCFRPVPANQVQATLAARRIPNAYLLVVGSLEARKDPETVLQALRLAPNRLHAVFVGPDAGFPLSERAADLGLGERVHALGHVADCELACLYRGALALVTASRAEGFGLPVVEAFACETPVVAAAATALPEVVGDAGLLFEPGDADGLAQALSELLDDPERGHALRRLGSARLAERFGPDAVCDALRSLYDSLPSR